MQSVTFCNPSKGNEIKRRPNDGHLSTLSSQEKGEGGGGELEKYSTNFRLSQSTWERTKLIKGDPAGFGIPLVGTTSQPGAKFELVPCEAEGFTEMTKETARNPIGHNRTAERFLS